MTNEASASNGWSTFKRLLKNVIDKHAPLVQKKIRGRDCPWLTTEIRKDIDEETFFCEKQDKQEKKMNGLCVVALEAQSHTQLDIVRLSIREKVCKKI